jgi:hypothetical protein
MFVTWLASQTIPMTLFALFAAVVVAWLLTMARKPRMGEVTR